MSMAKRGRLFRDRCEFAIPYDKNISAINVVITLYVHLVNLKFANCPFTSDFKTVAGHVKLSVRHLLHPYNTTELEYLHGYKCIIYICVLVNRTRIIFIISTINARKTIS